MIRRLVAIIVLCSSQAFAQEYDYTLSTPVYTGLENINQQQAIPTNLGDDGTTSGINIGFEFEFYGETFSTVNLSSNGVISFKNVINGCCSGELLPSQNQYNDFGIFGVWTDLVNIGTANPYYKTLGDEGSRRFVVGWYDQAMYYDSTRTSSFEITIFEGTNNILLNYGDINLGNTYTSGIQGYGSLGQFEQVYHGNNGDTLDYTSYLFTYSATEPPPPLPPEEPESPIAPDCTVNPNDTSCVINGIIDTGPVDEEMYADNNESFFEETNNSTTFEETFNEPAEELFADETFEDPFEEMTSIEEESLFANELEPMNEIEDLVDEAAAEQLADNIDANVLDIVLSIVEQTSATESTQQSSSQSVSSSVSSLAALANEDNSGSSTSGGGETQDQQSSTDNGLSAAEDILSAGVALNNQSLENIQNNIDLSIEQAAELENNVIAQAMESLETAIAGSDAAFQQMISDTSSSTESADSSDQTDMSYMEESGIESIEDLQFADIVVIEQQDFTNLEPEQTNDAFIVEQEFLPPTEQLVENTSYDFSGTVEESYNTEYQAAEEELIANVIQNSTKTFEEQEQQDFSNVIFEQTPFVPQMDAFTSGPMSVANLELTGVLKQNDDKSDAEKRAEEVVAANQAEQDAINADYMNADQSGIVAAIGADTDVTAYRNAMIPDASSWYKPEDIYRNVVIRDNVRGSYFLEKGNTDTYNRMIQEQYK